MATKKLITIFAFFVTPFLAYAEDWVFDAVLNDKVIGRHTFIVEDKKSLSRADFHIKFLFMDIYYQHNSEEIWSNGCIQSISSSTNDDGDHFDVKGKLENGHLALVSNDTLIKLSECVMTFAYWDKNILKQKRLLNSQNGEYLDVDIRLLKKETIRVRGESTPTQHYEIKATKDGQEKLAIQLWYDDNLNWVALKSPTPIGDIFYKLH